MIAHLKGIVLQRRPGEVVLQVGGVGYRVSVPLSTYSALPENGNHCELFIHTHVREDALALYGFASERERNVFELLISVSGIGPRLASNVLSGIDASDLLAVLAERDLERLQAIPGVGRKTAERLAVELGERARDLAGSEPAAGGRTGGLEGDLVSALINLGFSASQAARAGREARRSLSPGASLADAVREALRQITGHG